MTDHGLLFGSSNSNRWTREEIIAAIRRFHRERGRPPVVREWKAAGPHPSYGAIRRHFGSWANAIEAAGFPRPPVGVYPRPLGLRRGPYRKR